MCLKCGRKTKGKTCPQCRRKIFVVPVEAHEKAVKKFIEYSKSLPNGALPMQYIGDVFALIELALADYIDTRNIPAEELVRVALGGYYGRRQ